MATLSSILNRIFPPADIRKRHGLAALAMAAAAVGFFWQVIFVPGTWMPAGGGDLVPFLYPNYHFAAQHLKQGIIPLWNPHLYSGIPFAADAQSGLFYPLNLLVFLLWPELTPRTLIGLAIIHFWLAGFGMYLYLQHSPLAQRLTLSPLAAFAGGLAFGFSDLFVVHFGNLNMIAVAAWMPYVMLAFHRGLIYGRTGQVLAGGAVLGLASLAGHIQITLFILLTLAWLSLWTLGQTWLTASKRNWGHLVQCSRRPLGYLILSLLVMIGISALWLIPTLEMSRQTLRAGLNYEEAAAFSLNPPQLLGLIIPNFFGRDPALHWGPWSRVETGYIGILTLLLALIALLRQRQHEVRFLGSLALLGLLLALGDNSIIHGWLSLSPGFGQFRAPARYILLLDFGLAALAAVGIQHLVMLTANGRDALGRILKPLTWLGGGVLVVSLPLAYFALLITQDRNPEIFRRATAAVDGLVIFALLLGASLVLLHLRRQGKLPGARFAIAAILLIALDLFSLGAYVDVGRTDPGRGFRHPEAIQYLQERVGLNRLEVTTDVWHLWQPNTALLHGLYDAWGLYNPLTLSAATRYWQQVGPRSGGAYNFLGIQYIVASKAGAPADGDIVPVFDADPDINIYLNRLALPRVLFVNQAQIAADHEAAWAAVRAPEFDPTRTVILEARAPAMPTISNAEAEIALLQYDLHYVEIAVNATGPGYLVLSDTHYPGWRATVNGMERPIYRANYAFRAVPIPAGESVVRMRFVPVSWYVGLGLTGLTMLALLGYVGLSQRRTQSPPPPVIDPPRAETPVGC